MTRQLKLAERELLNVVTETIVSGHAREDWTDRIAELYASDERFSFFVETLLGIRRDLKEMVLQNPRNRMLVSLVVRLDKAMDMIGMENETFQFIPRILELEEVN